MAHLDEVGFLVRYIDEDGFIYFNNVGGYFSQSVLTQRLSILTPNGQVLGYTGMKSGHILPPANRMTMVPLEDMFIDVGARSREEVERMGIRPGLPITYATDFEHVLNGDEPVPGKGLGRPCRPRRDYRGATAAQEPLPSQQPASRGDGAGRNRPSRRLGGAGKYPTRHRDQFGDRDRERLSVAHLANTRSGSLG